METLEELERNVRRRMRWMMIAGIGVVIVLLGVVAVVGYLVVSHKDTHREHTSEQQKKNPHDTNGTSEGLVSTQDLAHVTWDEDTYIPAPLSGEHGPFQREGGRAWGFAQTPIGACLAVVNVFIRSDSTAGSNTFEPTINEQMIPTSDRDEVLAEKRQSYADGMAEHGLSVGDPYPFDPDNTLRFTAVRVISFDANEAIVSYIMEDITAPPTRQRYGFIDHLRWIDGDWKILAVPESKVLEKKRVVRISDEEYATFAEFPEVE